MFSRCEPGVAYQSPPEIYGHPVRYNVAVDASEVQVASNPPARVTDIDQQTTIEKHLAISGLIRAYQTRGMNEHAKLRSRNREKYNK